MTDEQWVWLFLNEAIDSDEQFEQLCPTCQREVSSGKHNCPRCGKVLSKRGSEDSFINPNFDVNRFNQLNDDIVTEIKGDGGIGESEN